MDTTNKVPYVAAALFCEKVIQEKDDVVTLVRVIDTYWIGPHEDAPADARQIIQPTVFLNLKSGDVTGKGEVTLSISKPSGGEPESTQTFPVLLKGGVHGSLLVVRLAIGVTEYGLYWFNVLWNGELLTRMPLQILQREDQDSTTETD